MTEGIQNLASLERYNKDPTNRIMQSLEAAVFATIYANLNLNPV